MHERTFIGLDVHARSVKAGVLDALTGEVNSLAVPVATQPLVAWCAPSRIRRSPMRPARPVTSWREP